MQGDPLALHWEHHGYMGVRSAGKKFSGGGEEKFTCPPLRTPMNG